MKRIKLLALALMVHTYTSALAQNNALHFDGTNDYLTVNPISTN
jgi:hypothetical protein